VKFIWEIWVNSTRVSLLEVPAARALKCLKQLGVGTGALVRGSDLSAAAAKPTP
jgi:hypothetical protein